MSLHRMHMLTAFRFIRRATSWGGGHFHTEGFEKEHIKAVTLYYFEVSKNIEGGKLVFKDPGWVTQSRCATRFETKHI